MGNNGVVDGGIMASGHDKKEETETDSSEKAKTASTSDGCHGSQGIILLDFRLSRGDGLEFKRHYLNLKQQLSHIELKPAPPLNWVQMCCSSS